MSARLKRILSIFWSSQWVIAVLLSLGYFMRAWPGDSFLPIRLINYFMPWIWLMLLLSGLIALMGRQGRLMIALIVPLGLFSWTLFPLISPPPQPQVATFPPIKLLSHNVLHNNHDMSPEIKLVQQERPDILLFQELTPKMLQELQAKTPPELATLYPHVAFAPDGEQALLTHYPIISQKFVQGSGLALKVVLDTPQGQLTVWNVHPTTPLHWPEHHAQLTQLVAEARQITTPFILAGDFNTTYGSEFYRQLRQHLGNAHEITGNGLSFTYPANDYPIPHPVLRIDHIFYSSDFIIQQASTITKPFRSNHLPIVAELALITQITKELNHVTQQ